MKKTIVSLTALLASSAALAGPIGYPGSTWGEFVTPSSVIKGSPEDNNWLYLGKVTQGIDWFKFGTDQKWTLDTYASFGFSMDRNHLTYNDKIVPAIGVRVDRSFNNGIVTVGVEALHERHFGDMYNGGSPVTGTPVRMSGNGVQAYVSYWFGWNLKK